MAITVGNVSSSGDKGSGTGYSWNHTCASGTTLLTVVTRVRDASALDSIVSGITYGGTPLTLARATWNIDTDFGIEVWYLINPTSGSSLSISVSHNGTVSDYSGAAVDLKGTDTTSPYDNYNNTTSLILPYVTVSISPFTSGAWSVGGMVVHTASVDDFLAYTGTTVDEVDMGNYCAGTLYASSATLQWNGVDYYDWTALAVSFKAAATGTQSTDQQPVYLKGKSGTADQQSAYLTGKATSTDQQVSYLIAFASSTDAQSAYLVGKASATDQQATYLIGKESSTDSQPAYLTAIDQSVDQQSAYLIGKSTSLDNQTAYLKGGNSVIDQQPGYLLGQSSQTDNQLSYTRGQDVSTDQQPSYLLGSASVIDQQPAYLTGQSGEEQVTDQQAAFVSGKDTSIDQQPSYLFGKIATPTLVYVSGAEHGVATLNSNGGGLMASTSFGSITTQSTYKYSGDYAYRLNPTAGKSVLDVPNMVSSSVKVASFRFNVRSLNLASLFFQH